MKPKSKGTSIDEGKDGGGTDGKKMMKKKKAKKRGSKDGTDGDSEEGETKGEPVEKPQPRKKRPKRVWNLDDPWRRGKTELPSKFAKIEMSKGMQKTAKKAGAMFTSLGLAQPESDVSELGMRARKRAMEEHVVKILSPRPLPGYDLGEYRATIDKLIAGGTAVTLVESEDSSDEGERMASKRRAIRRKAKKKKDGAEADLSGASGAAGAAAAGGRGGKRFSFSAAPGESAKKIAAGAKDATA